MFGSSGAWTGAQHAQHGRIQTYSVVLVADLETRAGDARTFQGHSVVMAVSLRLKNPNSTRLTAATASCTDTSCKLTNSGFGPRGTAPPASRRMHTLTLATVQKLGN